MAKQPEKSTTSRTAAQEWRGGAVGRPPADPATKTNALKKRQLIGERLRKYREDRGMYLYEVARKLKPPVWPQTVQKWESGEIAVRLNRLAELCTIYSTTVEELFK